MLKMNFCLAIVLSAWLMGCSAHKDAPETDDKAANKNQATTDRGIQFTPIGVFHSSYTPKTGAPRQGILKPEGKGRIEIFDPYGGKTLKDLGLFEYIIVLYYFDRVRGWNPTVHPPKSTHYFGLFATRSPKRPNPIAFSIVKLEGIVGNTLYLSGVDAFDGTPVLDIKPYLPSIDCIESEINRKVEKQLGHHNQVFIKDPSFFR